MSLTPVTARVAQVSAAIALVNMPLCHVIHSSVYLPPFGPHIQAFDNATSAHPFIVGIACLEVLCLFGAVFSGPRKIMSGSPALELALSTALAYANIAPALIPVAWIVTPETLRSSVGTALVFYLTASVAGVCFSRAFFPKFFPLYSKVDFWPVSRFVFPATDVSTVVCLVLRLGFPANEWIVETTEELLFGPLMFIFLCGGFMDAWVYDVSPKPVVDEKTAA